jgi:hypothetical protein
MMHVFLKWCTMQWSFINFKLYCVYELLGNQEFDDWVKARLTTWYPISCWHNMIVTGLNIFMLVESMCNVWQVSGCLWWKRKIPSFDQQCLWVFAWLATCISWFTWLNIFINLSFLLLKNLLCILCCMNSHVPWI